MKKLTVHVLDVATGESADGVQVDVERIEGNTAKFCVSSKTARNGRSEPALLSNEQFPAGHYRLHFHLGDYFAAQGMVLAKPRFLDIVTVDIGVGARSIHLPLLVTPWSYSVYRGS